MKRLLHFDEAPPLETPLTLLGRLREIDDNIELVHFGTAYIGEHGLNLTGRFVGVSLQDWRLGSVYPTPERHRVGEVILYHESKRAISNMQNVLLGRLALQGFAQIARYLSEGTPGVDVTYDENGIMVNVVDDFRERDYNWREDQGEKHFAKRLDETEGGPGRRAQAAQLQDMIHNDARAEFRRVHVQRTHSIPGISPGGLIVPPDYDGYGG